MSASTPDADPAPGQVKASAPRGQVEQTTEPETEDAALAVKPRSGRRLFLSYVLTVFALATVNFFLPRALPGDPLSLLQNMSAAYVEDGATQAELAEYYGLDRPLLAQYGHYWADLLQGDLGVSIRYRVPVAQLVRERLPWTLLLVGSALTIATAVGLFAGLHSGWRRGRRIDQGLLTLFLGIRNFPVFFLASLAAFVFAVELRWFPLAGATTPFSADLGLFGRAVDIVYHLVLPSLVLAVQFAAVNYLVMRGSAVSQLGSDHVLTGRAKGLGERRLKYRYVGRNALLPAVTVSTSLVGFAFSASILVETVFAYRGIGRLTFDAVAFRDYPTLQGCFLVITLVVLTVNFLAEALYPRIDPRTTGR